MKSAHQTTLEETYVKNDVRVTIVEFAVQIFRPVADLEFLHIELLAKIITSVCYIL